MLKFEVWKTIPKFSKYSVSSLGYIKNNESQYIFNPIINSSGYLSTTLTNDKKVLKSVLIHRIIVLTFLPNFYNKPTVDHKNRNKSDNSLFNLKWASYSEQSLNRNKYTHSIITNTIYENEIWKDLLIEDMNGLEKEFFDNYIIKISNIGRIHTTRGKWYGTIVNRYYRYKSTYSQKSYSIHRLVAIAFIQNNNKNKIINHIDGNKLNNNSINLEWCTYKENTNHAVNKLNNKMTIKIQQIDINTNNIIQIFNSIKDASNYIHRNRKMISMVCKGIHKLCGGYKWRYDNGSHKSRITNLNIPLYKSIKKIDINTNKDIAIYKSISDAAKQNNLMPSQIVSVLRGRNISSGGFLWEYIHEKTIKKPAKLIIKQVKKIDINTNHEIAIYKSIRFASRENNISASRWM